MNIRILPGSHRVSVGEEGHPRRGPRVQTRDSRGSLGRDFEFSGLWRVKRRRMENLALPWQREEL
jgi:hypothetical protein